MYDFHENYIYLLGVIYLIKYCCVYSTYFV